MDINALDIKAFASNAVKEVFETMLSMEVNFFEAAPQVRLDGNRVVGSVSFAGDIMGNISIHMSEPFSRLMAAAMLGIHEDEIEGEADVHDVVGEVSNMIGGNLKSRFCDSGMPCELSIPFITSGTNFSIHCRDWVRSDRFGFHNHQHAIFVEVCIKKG